MLRELLETNGSSNTYADVCLRMLCVQYMLRELLETNGSSRTHRFAIHKYRVLFVLSVDADAALQQMTVSRAHTLIKC